MGSAQRPPPLAPASGHPTVNHSRNLTDGPLAPILPKGALEPRSTSPKRKKPKTGADPSLEAAEQTFLQAMRLIQDEYDKRVAASNLFPPDISSTDIRSSVSSYEDIIASAAKRGLCSSCGIFVPTPQIRHVQHGDRILNILNGALDSCGRHGDVWDICSNCHDDLVHFRVPKFSAENRINVTLCQNYPSELNGLTPVEEALIAKSHPLGMILKLRPGGRSSPINYHAVKGHFIVIPQDPGPLLSILPSPELRLQDVIKVFWLNDRPPTNDALKEFLVVRKAKVLAALQYLVRHNPLYRDLQINQPIIDGWSDEFIPNEIQDNIIILDKVDHHEREGYSVNLETGNYENDLQAAQDCGSFGDLHSGPSMTGSVSTDINGAYQNPDLRLVDALLDVVSTRKNVPPHMHQHTDKNLPKLSYKVSGKCALLSHWTDPSYFPAAFPCLFPKGIGGHLDDRNRPVSLEAFAKWSLSHHSRRYFSFKV